MSSLATRIAEHARHPVQVRVEPALDDRNRITTAVRIVLAIPHLLLVGGPVAAAFTWGWTADGVRYEWGGAGVLGAVAVVAAIIAWFAILFTGRHPGGLWDLAAYYLRWRVRAVAYTALLRDEYPPFGDGPYPATLELPKPDAPRDRLTVAFRVVLALPHLVVLWVLGIAWAVITIVAWFMILFTGRHPATLHALGTGVLRWNVRVEAYLLLLTDVYPPFSLDE